MTTAYRVVATVKKDGIERTFKSRAMCTYGSAMDETHRCKNKIRAEKRFDEDDIKFDIEEFTIG